MGTFVKMIFTMRAKVYIILALLLGISSQAMAQIGLTAGYQLTHFTPGEQPVLHGFRGGLIYNVPLLGGISVEPGLLYAFGTNAEMDNTDPSNPVVINADTKVDEHYLHIPVHAKLRIPLQQDVAFIAYGGPTFAIGFKVPEGHTGRDTMIGAGAGFEFGPVIMHAGYDRGLHNRLADASLGTVHRGTFHVGISFYLDRVSAY